MSFLSSQNVKFISHCLRAVKVIYTFNSALFHVSALIQNKASIMCMLQGISSTA